MRRVVTHFSKLAQTLLLVCGLMLTACTGSARTQTTPHTQSPLKTSEQTHHAAKLQHGAVAADHPQASEAGAAILRAGGNAVDAAVATSFALSVTRPASCGIGGGGFMVIALPNDPKHGSVVTALNYRETAPVAVDQDFYEGKPNHTSLYGGAAVAIPGTVAGLARAHELYGLLPWSAVLQPAIDLAEKGFKPDDFHISTLCLFKERVAARQDPSLQVPATFLEPSQNGVVRNPNKARALRLIARDGASAFYTGEIANAIVRTVAATGGVLTAEDLAGYTPVQVEPMRFEFAGQTILTMPPPSSGGVALLQTLGIFERVRSQHQLDASPWASPMSMHVLVEATKHAFADRSRWLADPAFAPVPIERLTSASYLNELAGRISLEGVDDNARYGSGSADAGVSEDGGTSHLCVVDQWGGAVSCTETINTTYGSLVLVPEYGFVLNNEMDDFQSRRGVVNAYGLVQSDWNLPQPGKRPLSSMTPTIVLDDQGQVVMLAGAAGGPRIITATTQVLLRMLNGEPAGQAIAAARMHHQWMPQRLTLEHTDAQTIAALRALGHDAHSGGHASAAQAISRLPKGEGDAAGGWEAASDPRKGGRPAGH